MPLVDCDLAVTEGIFMKRFTFAFCFLFLSSSVWSIELEKKDRTPNQAPGYCVWASLETLGHHHKIESLFDLVEKRKKDPDIYIQNFDQNGKEFFALQQRHIGTDFVIREKLDQLKIDYKITLTRSNDRSLLSFANEQGVLVGVKVGARGPAAHIIVLTHYDGETIKFYDCNYPDDIWLGSREWFDHWWTGLSIVVEK
jgi:hypothetical protein